MSEATAQSIAPVTRTVTVGRTIDDAFRIFTEGMGSWWPLHTHVRALEEHQGVTAEAIVFEGRVGGRILEVMSNGTESPWAEVLEWEPPHRFVMAWKPHGRPTPPTEVEVRFTADGSGTRVELEHRGWERLGEVGQQGRDEYATGWIGVLERYRSTAEEPGG
jgi:uncharacterized protein YndB with AHSA1/START domain